MRPTGKTAAVLLVVALAAVGCSKSDKSGSKAEPAEPVQSKPVPGSGHSLAVMPTDEEGLIPDPQPQTGGPKSFADGEAAYAAKKYGEATMIFEHYTEQKPGNAWGHYMLGLSSWKGGDLAKAEQAFTAALAIDPDHLKSLVNLSRVLIEQNRNDDALDTLMHAGDIEPNSSEVHRLLGRAYRAEGKTQDAVDAYRRAIELDENDVWSMNNLALLFLEQKRAEDALPLLLEVVDLRKDVAAFHNNLGMALEHTRRFREAAEAYNDALTADSGYEKAKRNLARVEAVKVSSGEADERAGSR